MTIKKAKAIILLFLLTGIYLGYVEFYIQKDFTGWGVNWETIQTIVINHFKNIKGGI